MAARQTEAELAGDLDTLRSGLARPNYRQRKLEVRRRCLVMYQAVENETKELCYSIQQAKLSLLITPIFKPEKIKSGLKRHLSCEDTPLGKKARYFVRFVFKQETDVIVRNPRNMQLDFALQHILFNPVCFSKRELGHYSCDEILLRSNFSE